MYLLARKRGSEALLRLPQRYRQLQHNKALSSTTSRRNQDEMSQDDHKDVEKLLSTPTWSVSSLSPPKDSANSREITPKQLHHLLRLSALPPPRDSEEEDKMLSTLSSQLHFVKEIQKVDTTGVEPLQSLRDETAAGEKEAELGLEAMEDTLALEEVRGKHHKRIRRRNGERVQKEDEWDVLSTAGKTVGRFLVVDGGKDG